MEKFFISKGKEKKGPYLIDDLLKMELTDDYLIWKDGFEKWKSISEIEELKSKIIISPPPTPHQEKRKNQKTAFLYSLKISGIWLIVLWLFIFIVMGGFSDNYDLEYWYGSSDKYPIFGGGSVIRTGLIMASFLFSFGISLIILLFVYRDKSKIKNNEDIDEGTNQTA